MEVFSLCCWMFFTRHVVHEKALGLEPDVTLCAPVALAALPFHLPHLGQRRLIQVLLFDALPFCRSVWWRHSWRHVCRVQLLAVDARTFLPIARLRTDTSLSDPVIEHRRSVVERLEEVVRLEHGCGRPVPVSLELLMVTVKLDVTHHNVVAVETEMAKRTGVRGPVVHRRRWSR